MGLSDHRRVEATLSIADDAPQHGPVAHRAPGTDHGGRGDCPSRHRCTCPTPVTWTWTRSTCPGTRSSAPPSRSPPTEAVGRIAAEQITPYPPGIPAILPGERITADVLDYLRTGLQAGMVLPDPTDPSLDTIRVTTS